MIGFHENDSRAAFARKKYRIDDKTTIEMAGMDKPLGPGPLMDPATFQKFLDLDPSKDHKYLDWMLFQAGGGQELMEKSLSLWDGDGPSDSQSLKNQCKEDFVEERMRGYTDEHGKKHHPVTRQTAEDQWKEWEPRCQFEFVMGDQDVAFEDGFGLFRFWPGKDSIYQKVVNAVRMFHAGLPRLAANNMKYLRAEAIKAKTNTGSWTQDEVKFMQKYEKCPVSGLVELDIYKGWKPASYSQSQAVYKNLEDLLLAVGDLRKMRVLSDIRAEIVYEDEIVCAVAPFTIGASLRYGSLKWCTSNKTDFERSFDARTLPAHNWKTYSAKGPLIYLTFKVPMPDWLDKIAMHIEISKMKDVRHPYENLVFVDNQNNNSGTNYNSICERIKTHHNQGPPERCSAEDAKYRYGMRKNREKTWSKPEDGVHVLRALNACIERIGTWTKTFDMKKIVSDHLADPGLDWE